MDLENLRKIGLTEGEIKVYEALLELGECTKTALAKRSKIAPSNIYDITNRLLEKGIISKVEKNGISHFSPANPHRLLDFLNQKKEDIEKEKNFITSILPNLVSKFNNVKETINVEVFHNWNGLRTIFEDMLTECKKEDKNYVLGAGKGEKDELFDTFFLKYSKLREKKGIITHIIFNSDLKERKERIDFFLNSNMYLVKFLHQSTPSEIMTYKNKVCIILLAKEPIVIRITSKEVASSFRQYFDIAWKVAKL